MSQAMGRWLISFSVCLVPSSLLAADNNAKLIADGKAKLTAFREAEKKKKVDVKEAEVAAVKEGEIDANLKMTFVVTPAGKWKFQQEGYQLTELKRRSMELQQLNDADLGTAAPPLNLFTMKQGDIGRIELTQPRTMRLTELKGKPMGKDGLVVIGNLEQWATKDWRPTNTQRSFQVQGIDNTTEDYTKDIFVFASTTKSKGVIVPRLICIERSTPPAK